MATKQCPACRQMVDHETAQFCPFCGADLYESVNPWKCKKCGQVNEPKAMFCIGCGQSKELQKEKEKTIGGKAGYLLRSNVFKYGLLVLFVMLIGAGGSYYFFNNMYEGKYLERYAAAARTVSEAHDVIVSNIKSDVLSQSRPEDIRNRLKETKDALDRHAQEFAQKKPFKDYEKQHADVTDLLQKESLLIDQIVQITDNPLDENTDATMEEIKQNIDAIKDLSSGIQVPTASFTPSVDLASAVQQLAIFVSAKKKENKEKMERLAANQKFFRQMDEAIDQHNSAREDLGSMLESTRKSSIIWADYFNLLDRARSTRMSVRYKVDLINPPAGTEHLKQQYLAILDKSVRYCELMSMAAHLTFRHYYVDGDQKEKEAENLNRQVQGEYKAFLESYAAEKVRLTNVNNL